MPTIMDTAVLVLLLLPAILLMVLVLQSTLPRLSRSWREAEERAEQLVQSLLSPAEVEGLQNRGYLDVPSPNFPHRVYRVPAGAGTVTVMEGGQCIARLCVFSTEPIPEREAILVHKLMIEGSEQDYLRAANHLPC